jgi:TIR domain
VSEHAARDFFISYTAVDEPWARWIAVTLERAGYTTLLQAFDFRPGSDFIHLMQRATSGAARTIAVLSPAYLGSTFGGAEWRAAFGTDPTGESGRLIPVRVQPCEPPGLLAGRIFIDLVDADEATARQRLLAGVGPRGHRPTTAPFPGVPHSTIGAAGSPRFPGAGPQVSNLPARNPRFTGRDGMLAELRRRLHAGEGTLVVQALYGLGGVGKTQLALEYAHRFAADYQLGPV